MEATKVNFNLKGIGFLLLAMLIGSLQAVAVKWIGGNYSVLEIVTFRSLVALPITLLFFRLEGGKGLPTTSQPKLQAVRGIFLFLSYTTFMMGLAALPLADVEAIRFSGPMMITVLSVFMLSEKVELRRWLALIVGFAGILLIVKPGSTNFNEGSLFVLISVLFYALTVILTRKMNATDSSATMAYFSSWVYLIAAFIFSPLAAAVGEIPNAHPSIAFLFHAWTMPTPLDLFIMSGLGLVWALWAYFMTRAYSTAQASVIAPFEYASLPISIMWGFLFWREVPTLLTLAGAALTLASGMYLLVQDQKQKKVNQIIADNAVLENEA
ncbi:MAG: DMT family transporter [Anaerolineales bacterium]|uniref:DMT family transporter n=1 Tax=Candidatus Villigracilis proximus TaxID=3140683 RepID=UPI00313720C8|nr:DMT family transporter [Anaerolineales bacterium]